MISDYFKYFFLLLNKLPSNICWMNEVEHEATYVTKGCTNDFINIYIFISIYFTLNLTFKQDRSSFLKLFNKMKNLFILGLILFNLINVRGLNIPGIDCELFLDDTIGRKLLIYLIKLSFDNNPNPQNVFKRIDLRTSWIF